MRAYHCFIAFLHDRRQWVPNRRQAKERESAMRHNHDFDLASSTPFEIKDLLTRKHDDDRARAPRGLLTGVAISAGIWAAVIIGFVVAG